VKLEPLCLLDAEYLGDFPLVQPYGNESGLGLGPAVWPGHSSGPSRLAGFPLVGFGAEVASGSSDSTMAISSPGSESELRDGRRWSVVRNPKF
jgi:hypothetical protein